MGVVADIAPAPPTAMKNPLTTGQRLCGNHKVMALKLPIMVALTPSPISVRPATRANIDSPMPNKTAPAAAMASRTVNTVRGP